MKMKTENGDVGNEDDDDDDDDEDEDENQREDGDQGGEVDGQDGAGGDGLDMGAEIFQGEDLLEGVEMEMVSDDSEEDNPPLEGFEANQMFQQSFRQILHHPHHEAHHPGEMRFGESARNARFAPRFPRL